MPYSIVALRGNRGLHCHRRQEHRPRYPSGGPEDHGLLGGLGPAYEERQAEYDYPVSLICTLPKNCHRILKLKCVEEQTGREIAQRLKDEAIDM